MSQKINATLNRFVKTLGPYVSEILTQHKRRDGSVMRLTLNVEEYDDVRGALELTGAMSILEDAGLSYDHETVDTIAIYDWR